MNTKTEKPILRIVELCSGMGAQVKGFENSDCFDVKPIATADMDKEVIVSYAAIHCGLTKDLIENYVYPSKALMVEELKNKRIGYDFKNDKHYDWDKVARRKDKTKGIEKYWLADKISNNLGDIEKISSLPDCDLLTYSTPCQSISISGKQEGLSWTCKDCSHTYDPSEYNVEDRYTCPNCKSHNIKSTRSGLLYEVERLLVNAKDNENLPKYLMMENVDALVSKKYINGFNDWLDRLDNIGYNSYYKVINAKDTGLPQNRNRIFVISIRKDVDSSMFEFPKPFDTGIRLKDMLETDEKLLEKYFLSDEVQERLRVTNEEIIENMPIHIADLCSEKYKRMHEQSRRVYDEDGISPAMHTCGGGNTECKVSRNKLKIVRKITPKEANRLMGFDDIDYERCLELGMSDTQGYKQTGNSIAVSVITLIAQHLYKAQYDNTYVCFDEVVNSLHNDATNKVFNPLKGKSPYGWHFEQNVYLDNGILRTLKAGGGSGNIPKVIINNSDGFDMENFMNPPTE